MLDAGVDAFVEVARHPVLAASIVESLAARELTIPVLASMRRGQTRARDDAAGVRRCVHRRTNAAMEDVAGGPVSPVDLPAYPWQRERFWVRCISTSATSTRVENARGVVP